MSDDPLAFFITWTVYGTFLQGDDRGWWKREFGAQCARPLLANWHAKRLTLPVLLLTDEQRQCVNAEIERLSTVRRWRLWSTNARSNHVHVVVTANRYHGAKVRDQMKANATGALRRRWRAFQDRPIWTRGGDWKCINDEDELEQVILYVRDVQDRKHHDD